MKKSIFYIIIISLFSVIIYLGNILIFNTNIKKSNNVSIVEKQIDDYYNKSILKKDKEGIVLFYETKNKENNIEKLFFIDEGNKTTLLDSYIIKNSNKNFKTIKDLNLFYKTIDEIGNKGIKNFKNIENVLKKVFTEKEVKFILSKLKY